MVCLCLSQSVASHALLTSGLRRFAVCHGAPSDVRASRCSKSGATGQAGNCTSHARTVNGAEKTWLKSMWRSPHLLTLCRDNQPKFSPFSIDITCLVLIWPHINLLLLLLLGDYSRLASLAHKLQPPFVMEAAVPWRSCMGTHARQARQRPAVLEVL